MTQSVFYNYGEYFVRSLPPDQGKDGLPCILIFDGHVSKWNLAALQFLILNNFFLLVIQLFGSDLPTKVL